MRARPTDQAKRRYVCSSGPGSGGCGKLAIVAEDLETFIVDAVLYRLDSPDLPASLSGTVDGSDGAEWQAEIEQKQAKLDELAQMWAEDSISRSEWLKARAPIEKRQIPANTTTINHASGRPYTHSTTLEPPARTSWVDTVAESGPRSDAHATP